MKEKIVAMVRTMFMALNKFARRILKALGPEDPKSSLWPYSA